MSTPAPADLVVVTADRNAEYALKGLLGRVESLGIRKVDAMFLGHPEHDSGCLLRAHELLRTMQGRAINALVVLDHEGCGNEEKQREELEAVIESRIVSTGWPAERCRAIVIVPELEAWVWSDSPHVDEVLGWGRQGTTSLRDWLREKGWLADGQFKPERPKEAMLAAMALAQKSRSSSLYSKLASRVSFERCTDAAFARLKVTLRQWFGDGKH